MLALTKKQEKKADDEWIVIGESLTMRLDTNSWVRVPGSVPKKIAPEHLGTDGRAERVDKVLSWYVTRHFQTRARCTFEQCHSDTCTVSRERLVVSPHIAPVWLIFEIRTLAQLSSCRSDNSSKRLNLRFRFCAARERSPSRLCFDYACT